MQKTLLAFFFLFIGNMAFSQVTEPSDNISRAPLKIGDIFPTNLHTNHPYNSTGVNGILFEEEFYSKNSSYVKLHFKDFDLAPGDYLEITGVNTGESILYSERGKIIDKQLNMISDFWSQVIFDDRVVVRLHSNASSSNYGFEIEEVAYGYPQKYLDELFSAKAICGTDDKEPIICYNGTTMHTKGEAVCRLIIGGAGSCTGWLLGCDGHVMTNNHCIGSVADALNTDFVFDFHHTNCNGTGNSVSNTVAATSTMIKTNGALDYTLVQLPVNPTPTYGNLSLSSVAPQVDDRIYIVGHPGGRRKEITVITDLGGTTPGGFAMVNQITGTGCRYMADTEGGSSGSPVLDFNSNLVVAIHNTGGCTNGSSGRNDQLIAAIGTDMPNCGIDDGNTVFTPCSNIVNTFPYSESFENTLGFWAQMATDDFDWTVQTGATPTASTGPTAANDGAYYLYTESSAPNNPNLTANVISPCFNVTSLVNPQLSFDYHMFGATTGSLIVEASVNSVSWTTLRTITGNQGNSWQTAVVGLNNLATATELRIRFRAVTSTGETSDIAIDAFSLGEGSCELINSFPYNASFENTFDGWLHDGGDDFNWAILSGGTPSNNTGPAAANDGSYYAYMESSNPNFPSRNSILYSPCFDLSAVSNSKAYFDYHMFGAAIGTLSLEVSVNAGAWTSVWSRTGQQGTAWIPDSLDLSPYANTTIQLRFNGTTGNSFTSDMAIDAFSLENTSISLPIDWLDFDATRTDIGNVLLNWSTASEINNQGFEVERMFENETTFEKVAWVTGNGTSNGQSKYAHKDPNGYQGTTYYRLKQVDFDGTFEYSKIQAVNGTSKNSKITLFPNPTKEVLNIQLQTIENQQLSIQVLDSKGSQVLLSKHLLDDSKIIQLHVIKELPQGIYLIKILTKTGTLLTKKFVKH